MIPNLRPTRDETAILAATVQWLERAVIGLNLCPFARGVHVKGQIHYAVARAQNQSDLLAELTTELQALQDADPQLRDTTLWILPDQFPEFLDFNSFVAEADRLLDAVDLGGVLQIASFHPQFQFAGTLPDDITNYTNRAPFAALHLLREESIDRAVAAYPQAEAIYEKNMQTLQSLGHAGWINLWHQDADLDKL